MLDKKSRVGDAMVRFDQKIGRADVFARHCHIFFARPRKYKALNYPTALRFQLTSGQIYQGDRTLIGNKMANI